MGNREAERRAWFLDEASCRAEPLGCCGGASDSLAYITDWIEKEWERNS